MLWVWIKCAVGLWLVYCWDMYDLDWLWAFGLGLVSYQSCVSDVIHQLVVDEDMLGLVLVWIVQISVCSCGCFCLRVDLRIWGVCIVDLEELLCDCRMEPGDLVLPWCLDGSCFGICQSKKGSRVGTSIIYLIPVSVLTVILCFNNSCDDSFMFWRMWSFSISPLRVLSLIMIVRRLARDRSMTVH